VAARDDRKRFLEVAPQFIGGARLAGVVAGDGQPAAQFLAGVLEAADIIPLPAVDRNGDLRQLFQGFVRIHTHLGIPFFGELVGLFDVLRIAHK